MAGNAVDNTTQALLVTPSPPKPAVQKDVALLSPKSGSIIDYQSSLLEDDGDVVDDNLLEEELLELEQRADFEGEDSETFLAVDEDVDDDEDSSEDGPEDI